MELHQLQYFIAIAKLNGFSNAAKKIHVAQSSLSLQIQKLEQELGTQLFERNTRSVVLTEAGREFLGFAVRIMNETNKAANAMQKYASTQVGHLIVGALPVMGYLGITKLITAFRRANPEIELELREAGSSVLSEWLLSGTVDLAFLTPPTKKRYRHIRVTPLIEDELVVVAPGDHSRLGAVKKIDMSMLKDEKFILMKPDNGMHYICLELCKEAGFLPEVACESNQIDTIVGLVADGLGITLLTSRVAKAFSHQNITIVQFVQATSRITALAVMRNSRESFLVNRFCQFVEDNKGLLV